MEVSDLEGINYDLLLHELTECINFMSFRKLKVK